MPRKPCVLGLVQVGTGGLGRRDSERPTVIIEPEEPEPVGDPPSQADAASRASTGVGPPIWDPATEPMDRHLPDSGPDPARKRRWWPDIPTSERPTEPESAPPPAPPRRQIKKVEPPKVKKKEAPISHPRRGNRGR